MSDAPDRSDQMNYVIFGNSEADPITDLSANATLNWESGRSDESVGNGFKYSVADAYICTYVEAEPEPPVDTEGIRGEAVAGEGGARDDAASAEPAKPIPALPGFGLAIIAGLILLLGGRATRR
ncbi:hypothetical protein [Halioglobus japonicus]|uniref:Uncharacterized protein n=1 Tax=Halioglobus japonicus TaxID=930805 RepID=A0AAP8MFT9_9GAMM|nr:hypothetical protein [Halioglobus japonicus]PLW87028.1 hypothetical protein C0029_00015 [Halioglobus japonicus]